MGKRKLLIDKLYNLLDKKDPKSEDREIFIRQFDRLKNLDIVGFARNSNRNAEILAKRTIDKKTTPYFTSDLKYLRRTGYISALEAQERLMEKMEWNEQSQSLRFDSGSLIVFPEPNVWIEKKVFQSFLRNEWKAGINYKIEPYYDHFWFMDDFE